MPLRQLGRTQITISPIGLGCWQFSSGRSLIGKYWGSVQPETIQEVVGVSWQNGVNWFDTAEVYGRGMSERSLSAGLQAVGVKPEEAIIATKWMPLGRTADSLTAHIDIRLKELSPYPISLLQIHNPLSFSSIESQRKVMAQLIDAGKIRAAGVSNFNLAQMRRAAETLAAQGSPLASNQMRYNMLDRRIEDNGVLEYAKQTGITIIAYSPLAQGLLTGRFHGQRDGF